MAKVIKQFYEYISPAGASTVTLSNYQDCPASAFLKYVVSAKNASYQCLRTFKTKKRKKPYSNRALSSIQTINAGLLASIMGNFETYQKYLFAQMFENTIYLKKFDVKVFIKNLEKACNHGINIDIERFSAFRNNPTAVGLILADSLKNWQSPSIVNDYFNAFGLKKADGHPITFYSNETKETLSILWQMRHSIVHTASTITIPDAQKIDKLKGFAGKEIVLDLQFVMEVARKMHPIIKESTKHMEDCFIPNLKTSLPPSTIASINKLFEVKSSCAIWLR